MNICFISFSNIVDDVRIAKEVKELIRAGFKVGAIGVDAFGPIKNSFNIVNLELILLKKNLLPANTVSSLSKIRKNTYKIKHCFFVIGQIVKFKPKVVHVCNLELLIAVFLVCKTLRIKIVYDSFEIWADMGRTLFRQKVLNSIVSYLSKVTFMFLEKHIVRNVDYFICVSHSMADYFAGTYSIKHPIVLTNAPYSCDVFKEKTNGFIDVLYHGIYSPGRGIEELIKSATYLKKTVRIVLRLSYVENKQYLQNLIDEYKVGRIVVFSDPVAMSEVVIEASRSHIGVVFTMPTNTNHIHTVSNKIFDYINAGIPVIMTNVKEHVFLNRIYNFGIIITDFNDQTVAEAITSLTSNSILYKNLSDNCRKAAKVLNWQEESKKLVSLYSKIAP